MSELPPSETRRREARQRGQVPHSPLLTGAATLGAGGLALSLVAGPAARRIAELARRALSGELPVEAGLPEVLRIVSWVSLSVAVPALLAAAAAGAAQTRGLFTAGAFGQRTLDGDDEEDSLPLAHWALAAALILFAVLSGRRALLGVDALEALWPRAVLLFAAAGAADFVRRRARMERALRMTRAERRAEERQEQGDPRLRSERKRRHRAAVLGKAPDRRNPRV